MESSLLIAGYGGQGVLSTGKIIIESAMIANKKTTYYPAYGGEQRGGTANCTVIVSDDDIASPVLKRTLNLIVFNEASLMKFEDSVEKDGFIFVNSSLVKREVWRKDIKAVYIPANDLAESAGSNLAANMVMLGSFIAATGILPGDAVLKTLHKLFSHKTESFEVNLKAFNLGMKHGVYKTETM